mmetsp:Transcript_2/g.5  ORF Transcript_2/g.5 Transcript_2/m.5 type:complete len:216 (+) Transcript_2:165-812(+)
MPSPINLDQTSLLSSSGAKNRNNDDEDLQLSGMPKHDQQMLIHELIHDVPLMDITPEIKTLMTHVMRRLRNIGTKAEVVEDLLMRMIREEDARPRFRVYHGLYGIAIDAWAKQQDNRDKVENTEATIETKLAPAERAENIFKLMHMRSQDDSTTARPSLHILNVVLHGWANSRHLEFAPKRAEGLLDWSSAALGLEPDIQLHKRIPCLWATWDGS